MAQPGTAPGERHPGEGSPGGMTPGRITPGGVRRLNPSFYPESQGAFADRVRRESVARLGLPCGLELAAQTEFPEPPVRINTDLCDAAALNWDESTAWDEFILYLSG